MCSSSSSSTLCIPFLEKKFNRSQSVPIQILKRIFYSADGFNGSGWELNHWTSLHCGFYILCLAKRWTWLRYDIQRTVIVITPADYDASLIVTLRAIDIKLAPNMFLSTNTVSKWLNVIMAGLCNRAGHIYFHPVFLLSFFHFFPRLISAVGDWMSTIHTRCGLSVNLQYRSETCCARLAENTARKKSPKTRHLGTIPKLSPAISSQLRRVSTIGKKSC